MRADLGGGNGYCYGHNSGDHIDPRPLLSWAVHAVTFTINYSTWPVKICAMNKLAAMKKLALVSATLAALIVGGLFLLSLAFSDIASDTYPTLQEARNKKLFERGWLPDILPPSSHNIETNNNLDLNTSWGKFSFSPNEYSLFESRTGSYSPEFDEVMKTEEATKIKTKGFAIRTFKEGHTLWVFQCKPQGGVCEYSLDIFRG